MHELGMCESVLAAVEQRAGDRRVASVGVRAGARLRVVPEAFQTLFGLVAEGGVAAGATTDVTIVPVEGSCRSCGVDFATSDPILVCPECGSVAVDARGGDELVLEWIRYHDDREE